MRAFGPASTSRATMRVSMCWAAVTGACSSKVYKNAILKYQRNLSKNLRVNADTGTRQ